MEQKHKLSIQKNYLDLIHKTDIKELLPRLIQNGVFSDRSAEPYQNPFQTELNLKRELFVNIQRRGPQAFDKLVSALRDIGDYNHIYVACLLEGKELPEYIEEKKKIPANNPHHNNHNINKHQCTIPEETDDNNFNSQNGTVPFKLTESQRPSHIRQLSQESPYAKINLAEEPLKIVVKKAEKFFDDLSLTKVPTYRMRGKCRGAYLGINNIEFINNVKSYRAGAEVDEHNLKELFKQMGFTISSYRNQTKMDMKTTIRNFTDVNRNHDLKHADCLVIAIMSHGVEGDSKDSSCVVTSNNELLEVSWIIEQFSNENCPAFQNKPKIFIFQICRGDNFNYGIPVMKKVQSDGFNSTPGYIIRKMTDVLVAYSTLPGDESYRDINLGTWYIQLICEVFMHHAYDTDVEHMLKMVDDKLKLLMTDDNNMQTSTYESRAFQRCFFHPGLHE